MRPLLNILSFLLLASGICAASAEESYSAKSMFFGEDDSVIAVSTTQKTKPVASTPEAVKKPATVMSVVRLVEM